MLLKDIIINRKNDSAVAVKHKADFVTYEQLHNLAEKHACNIRRFGHDTRNIGVFLPNSIRYPLHTLLLPCLIR